MSPTKTYSDEDIDRLETIIDYDKVLVLEAGRLVAFASPAELLRDEASIFSSLCRDSGNYDSLKAMALAAEKRD